MEMMRQRVRAAPLLLEGATHWGPKVGQLSHSCTCNAKPHNLKPIYCASRHQTNSKLSNYSESKSYGTINKDDSDSLGVTKDML